MSAWTTGGDPAAWQYQQTSGSQLSSTQPSTSINPQFEPWNPEADYGGGNSLYGQAEYGVQSVDQAGSYQQFSQGGQVNSFNTSSSLQTHHPQTAPYPPSDYPHTHQQSYPTVSNPPTQPPPPHQPYLENHPSNPSYRYGPPPSELPAPSHSGSHLSSTAQRFQNAVPSPTYDSSSNLPPPQQPSQPQQQNFAPNTRPTPAPASIQQYHRKVDELAMLEHRLAQLQSILSRGTMAEPGRPGASQPILENQRAHLQIQLNEFKNRQMTLLNECDAFTRHFGPASSWDTSSLVPPQNQSPGPSGPVQRARTISAGLQQTQLGSTPPSNGQYGFEGQGNVPHQHPYPTTIPYHQAYPNNEERQSSSNAYDASLPLASNGIQQMPPTGYNLARGPTPSQSQSYQDPQQQNSYPPQPSSHQRFSSAPNAGPSPSYTHISNSLQLQQDLYQSPSQQNRQTLPPNQPVVSSNPLPPSAINYSGYPPPSNQPQISSYHQPHQYQQVGSSQSQPLQPYAPQRPSSRPAPLASTSGSFPVPQQHQRQSLPPGLQAQMDALARDQAATNGRSRGNTGPNPQNQNPLQILVKKAENGEMPVMTMSGLRKASDVEREKKEEEEREKARIAKAGMNGNGAQKLPTTTLSELCRQGGGPTLAEMVMTIDHQVFWTQLQQSCAKRNINVFDEVHQGNFVVETKPVDLLQLFQTVVSRGGGYGKIDAGNAWPHVATLLSISTRSAAGQIRIKEIYHRILAPFEDIWATQMIKLREKQRAMDEARRVLGAMPAASSSTVTTSSPHQAPGSQPKPAPPPQAAPSPLSNNSRLAPPNQAARRSPAQTQTATPQAAASSSMFANPISYNSLQLSDPYPGAPPSQSYPPPLPSSNSRAPAPIEKPVTSADLLEQARALRKNATPATNGGGEASSVSDDSTPRQPQQQPLTTSPPQETSSTPQEAVTTSIPAPAPVVDAASKPSPSSASKSVPSTANPVQSAIAAAGHVAPFSTSMAQLGIGTPAIASIDSAKKNTRNTKKRKNEDSDGANEGPTTRDGRTRDRSMSNLEAPVVGQQTNEPHFNPFEINHFLPFTTAPPSIVPSPTSAVPPPSLPSDPNNSAKSSLSNPRLPGSISGETISPQSVAEGASLASPGTLNGGTKALAGVNGGRFDSAAKSSPDFGHSPFSASHDPVALDSISLSMSLDPLAASRPGTSWSMQDSAIANGLSAFDSFTGGLDGYSFPSNAFDDGLHGLDSQSHIAGTSLAPGTGLPNWSPSGLDGFDFGNTFS